MVKKQGITVTVMVITVIILTILAGTITFSIYSTVNYSNLSSWANEIMYVQDVVDEELNSSSIIDYTLENIAINTSLLTQEAIQEQFVGETIEADNIVVLRVLDLEKLRITDTKYGNLTTKSDVYAVSEDTGRVYYVAGITVDGNTYYSTTNSLKNRFGLTVTSNNLTSVVFVPSKLGHTNSPVSLIIKVPSTYNNIVISTSNDEIDISSQSVEDNIYVYNINDNLVVGNYTVTVSYNDGMQTLTSKYEVNGYDVTAPVIAELTTENFVYKQTDTTVLDYLVDLKATDESGIRVMKYAIGMIDEEDVQEYFRKNGNVITDERINLDRTADIYTIYAEDNAGNFSTLVFDKTILEPKIANVTLTAIEGNAHVEVATTLSQGSGVSYEYSYRVKNTSNYTQHDETTNTALITGLKGNTTYEVKVTAKNFYGTDTLTKEVTTSIPTLGGIIASAADYGKTVNYSVDVDGTTYTDWQVYYANDSYVFLIKQNGLGKTYLEATDPSDLTAEQYSLYNICKLGKTGYDITDGEVNCSSVAWLISNYSNYASTSDIYKDSNGESYVVGAIGGPTIELLAAGWNAKRALNPTLYNKQITPVVSEYGYMINDGTTTDCVVTGFNSDGLYLSTYWLASPSTYMMSTVMCTGTTYITFNHTVCDGAKPIVCLRADIPAHVRTTTDTVTTDYVLD